MSQNPPLSSKSLPGPVTSPNAPIPRANVAIPLQSMHVGLDPSVSDEYKKARAWKYEGYTEFSRWMASEDDFFLFRRFESLNAGVILWMQEQISQKEAELMRFHKGIEDAPHDLPTGALNSSHRWDAEKFPARQKLMHELSGLLHHYNEYVEAFSKMRARPRAEKHQVRNVENWLKRGAISPEETTFIRDHKSDLVSINSRVRPPVGQWLEARRLLHNWSFFRKKYISGLHIKSSSTSYSNNDRFDMVTNMSIIFLGLAMLLAPLWLLEQAASSSGKLKTITVFIVVFVIMGALGTVNKPFEVVAATAAYAAVLMVFMQIEKRP
ncbi:hypothetical protein BS50DRAFT_229186 [Corynespora cassiicola Philippines]|uniref:DUF6594 domain-containing protein n=1 Tax=Corynespora cassiicola Philippines TaxID=1448308 RepID=A0A2T2N244_CORCC|nr:hypothetical protein BS50DRAFT_229186 [Corynespora cassiicola Philippines]